MDITEKQQRTPPKKMETQSFKDGTSPQAAKIPTDPPSPSSPASSTSSVETPAIAWLIPVIDCYNSHFAWVSNNNNWSKVKPVIRCAVAAWISSVLFLIPAFELAVGQVSDTSILRSNPLTQAERRAFSSSLVGTSAASETSTKPQTSRIPIAPERPIHVCCRARDPYLAVCDDSVGVSSSFSSPVTRLRPFAQMGMPRHLSCQSRSPRP